MVFSNVCTPPPATLAQELGWRSANASQNDTMGGSGSNPTGVWGKLFTSPSHIVNKQDADAVLVSILLVEDNPGDVGLIRETLSEHSITCDLVVVDDGDKAIERIREIESDVAARPNLIILDLNLPKRNGKEVLQRLRESTTCRDIPTVVLSSSSSARDINDVTKLGADRFITKPAHLDEFLSIGEQFKELLQRTRSSSSC